jgi:hypothetical protein
MVMQATNSGPNIFIPNDEMYDAPEAESSKPSALEVLDLLREGKSYFGAFHSACRIEDDFFYNTFQVDTPDGHETVIPATGRSQINVATDHVDINNISVLVPSSARQRARAEKLQRFYTAIWQNIDPAVLRTAVRQSFLYGLGFLKPMYDADNWPDSPRFDDYADPDEYKEAMKTFMDRRDMSFPFTVKNVNPQNLVWDDSRSDMGWAIEFYDRDPEVIKRKYKNWSGLTRGKATSTWLEYWDKEWMGIIVDNDWLEGYPIRHEYGFMPYKQILPANATDLEMGLPQQRFQGLLKPVHQLLKEEARILTAYGAIIRRHAWTTLNFSGPTASAEMAKQNYEQWEGFNTIPPGVTVSEGPVPHPPQELLAQLNNIQTAIEMATFPNVIRGMRPRGVSSGFQVSVLSGMGRLVFSGVAQGMSRAIQQCNSGFAKIVENKLRDKVTVFGRASVERFDQTVGPRDINGMYDNIVELSAEAPEEAERRAILGKTLFESGIISLMEAQRRAGVVSPFEEQLQIGAERLLNSPQISEMQAAIAAERIGLLNQLTEASDVEGGGGEPDFSSQFQEGLSQLQRPGEAAIQRQRVASQGDNNGSGQDGVGFFPTGPADLDNLAAISQGNGGAIQAGGGKVR